MKDITSLNFQLVIDKELFKRYVFFTRLYRSVPNVFLDLHFFGLCLLFCFKIFVTTYRRVSGTDPSWWWKLLRPYFNPLLLLRKVTTWRVPVNSYLKKNFKKKTYTKSFWHAHTYEYIKTHTYVHTNREQKRDLRILYRIIEKKF